MLSFYAAVATNDRPQKSSSTLQDYSRATRKIVTAIGQDGNAPFVPSGSRRTNKHRRHRGFEMPSDAAVPGGSVMGVYEIEQSGM